MQRFVNHKLQSQILTLIETKNLTKYAMPEDSRFRIILQVKKSIAFFRQKTVPYHKICYSNFTKQSVWTCNYQQIKTKLIDFSNTVQKQSSVANLY